MICVVLLPSKPSAGGTKYSARVMHSNEESKKKHETMGFYDGWNKAAEQLADYMKSK